ncbi:hypothetical protein HanPI659440_Chr10g0369961 [Helianthus annuus]|nr:hypothetical protein HanPI659440_Chr10g0369961 [Helianthus annuus]
MKNRIGFEDFLDIRVVSSKAVMWTSGFGEKQPHGITLVPESGLDTDEHISILFPVNQKVLTIGVQVPWWLSPVLF